MAKGVIQRVFLVVFALTVLTDLPTARGIGMILAAGLFVNRISQTMQITAVDENTGKTRASIIRSPANTSQKACWSIVCLAHFCLARRTNLRPR